MNLKIGNDIIETARIKKLYNKYQDRFKRRVFTEKEINYCEERKESKYESYAARFAAKEAVFKAISANLENKYKIEWKDIEILNDSHGRPYVIVKNVKFIDNIDITMSHVKEYAIATALVSFKD